MVRNQLAASGAAIHGVFGFPLRPHNAGPGAIAEYEHLEVPAQWAGHEVITLITLAPREFDAAGAFDRRRGCHDDLLVIGELRGALDGDRDRIPLRTTPCPITIYPLDH